MLAVGETAPGFELQGTDAGDRETFRLSKYAAADQWVFLTFYTFDFNPICTEGMCALRDAEFFSLYDDMALLGVSGDGIHSHEKFATEHRIDYPLLSDTGKDVAESYGVLQAEYEGMRRVHQRAVFVIDDSQTIRLAETVEADSPDDVDLDGLNDELRDIRH